MRICILGPGEDKSRINPSINCFIVCWAYDTHQTSAGHSRLQSQLPGRSHALAQGCRPIETSKHSAAHPQLSILKAMKLQTHCWHSSCITQHALTGYESWL